MALLSCAKERAVSMPAALCSCLSRNRKTLRSIDLSTICPNLLAGKPCVYCYVEAARRAGRQGKLMHDRVSYRGEIKRLREPTVARLNGCGGARLFAFGDYFTWMDDDLAAICDDADARRLALKAITKQPEFVHRWHDRMRVINVSVDNVGCGVEWNVARELRERYPNVLVRAAIMRMEDLDALSWVDIVTLNHACNGFKLFSAAEKEYVASNWPMKVCCLTGSCENCLIKCG